MHDLHGAGKCRACTIRSTGKGVAIMANKHAMTDHLGNEYSSIQEMCEAYGITRKRFYKRFHLYHWSLEDALTKPVRENNKDENIIKDHLGNEYASKVEMCKAYDITPVNFNHRISYGWSLEDALTVPVKKMRT